MFFVKWGQNELYIGFDKRIHHTHSLQFHKTQIVSNPLQNYYIGGGVPVVSIWYWQERVKWKKRYDFIYINLDNEGDGDMSRSRKKSFDWYKEVIETNGASILE